MLDFMLYYLVYSIAAAIILAPINYVVMNVLRIIAIFHPSPKLLLFLEKVDALEKAEAEAKRMRRIR